jgi:hypothetical protein
VLLASRGRNRSPSLGTATAEQMEQMQKWLDEAKAKGIKKGVHHLPLPGVLPVGFGPIPAPDNPHKLIASYAKDMEIVVSGAFT